MNKSKSNFKEQCEHQYVASPLYSSPILPQKYGNPQNSRLRVKNFMFKGSNTSAINLQVGVSQKEENLFTLPVEDFLLPFRHLNSYLGKSK